MDEYLGALPTYKRILLGLHCKRHPKTSGLRRTCMSYGTSMPQAARCMCVCVWLTVTYDLPMLDECMIGMMMILAHVLPAKPPCMARACAGNQDACATPCKAQALSMSRAYGGRAMLVMRLGRCVRLIAGPPLVLAP